MPETSDSYFCAARASECELKEKGSRFIGRVYPIADRTKIEDTLDSLRKKEHDATHHCFAWRLRDENEAFRYSDDGEPGGSAGKPIYDQLCGADVTNTLVVVTRYFGGTKLGVGGLVRAYGSAAKAALEASGRVERFDLARFSVVVDFPLYKPLTRLAQELEATILNSDFSDRVTVELAVRQSRSERFEKRFTELTHGKGQLSRLDQQPGEDT